MPQQFGTNRAAEAHSRGCGGCCGGRGNVWKVDIKGKKAVCLVSGGNIDVSILSRVITRGLLKAGRFSNLCVALTDKPGQLELVSKIIAEQGGNVVSVHYNKARKTWRLTPASLHYSLKLATMPRWKQSEKS